MNVTKRALGTVLCAVAAMAVGRSSAAALDKVTYLLPAPAVLPATGPWLIALQKGYYAAEGLEVSFEVAKGGVDVAKQVGAGNAIIGGAIGDTPIIVRSNGVPVKAVALLGGGSLMQLVVHEDSGINGPADLKGKTIAVMAYQDTTFYALLGMLANVGLTKNDVSAQAVGPANVWKLFVARKVQAMAAVPDWIGHAVHAGAKVKVIPANAYFPSMAQAIIASDAAIAAQPSQIERLVRATLKGVRDIMDGPRSAAQAYIAAVPQHVGQEGVITQIFELFNRYVYGGQKTLGLMDERRLATLAEFYLKSGITERPVAIDQLFTNQFIR